MIGAIIAKQAMVKAFQAMDDHDLKTFMSPGETMLYSFTLAKYMPAELSRVKQPLRVGFVNFLNNSPKLILTFRISV